MTDILFIVPNNSLVSYQKLSEKFSAIEPPTWALLLAESCRSIGFEVKILDTLAENLTDEASCERVKLIKPSLICFVVYGQNVNAGSTNMSGATRLSKFLKSKKITQPIGFLGSHVQALPQETLKKEQSIDFVFLNEGIVSLHEILKTQSFSLEKLKNISGLAVKIDEIIQFTGPPVIVPQEKLDQDLPGYAWDLLPYKNNPLDLYRSPLWHANYQENLRSPYAAIQTSIGCKFKCSFCMINLINKDDDNIEGCSSNYNIMRHWSVDFVEKELKKLINLGVKTIRITDEMFLLNKKYYMPIIELLIKLNEKDDLYFWVYSRIDTIPNIDILKLLRKSGIRWIALGIESGNKKIRLEVAKGKFEEVDVERIVSQIENAGIHVMANYIYGLPGDSEETIQETYNLSKKLNTLGWNTYAAMALPGSPLYFEAKNAGVRLPSTYEEFSFHSFESIPLPTSELSASRVLELRDQKFNEYFDREEFYEKISDNFGHEAVINIKNMLKIKLKRKIVNQKN